MRWLALSCLLASAAHGDTSVRPPRPRGPAHASAPRLPASWGDRCERLLNEAQTQLTREGPPSYIRIGGGADRAEVTIWSSDHPGQPPLWSISVEESEGADSDWREVPSEAVAWHKQARGRHAIVEILRLDAEWLRPLAEGVLKPAADACLEL